MNYAHKSIVGRRKLNEDSVCILTDESGLMLLAVADGMGGHAAGDVASAMVTDGLREAFPRISASENRAEALRRAIRNINIAVYRAADSMESRRGMGSTLVCVLAGGEGYLAASVGDSRLYHFDGTTLSRITTDHSLVETLVSQGVITREEAAVHPMRNIITRAVGSGLHVEVDLFQERLSEGDLLLLCTDGLHGSLDDAAICEILRRDASLAGRCDMLIDAASDAGSEDNITAVLVRCGEEAEA